MRPSLAAIINGPWPRFLLLPRPHLFTFSARAGE